MPGVGYTPASNLFLEARLTGPKPDTQLRSFMHRLVRALWPMLAWMVVVFVASTDFGAESHTSRWLVPILRWFDPTLSHVAIERVHLIVRKAGHVTEYAVLAMLI